MNIELVNFKNIDDLNKFIVDLMGLKSDKFNIFESKTINISNMVILLSEIIDGSGIIHHHVFVSIQIRGVMWKIIQYNYLRVRSHVEIRLKNGYIELLDARYKGGLVLSKCKLGDF